MKRIRLGRTGLEVSPVCYGTWQLSPRFWGDQPKETMIAALRRAPEVGVNFFDTANAYGDGLAETTIGEALKGVRRDSVVIATKVFHHFYPDGRRHPDLTRNFILEECDASLRRLRTDYIDLYQCHSYDTLTPMEETAGAMESLKKAGKIRAYGASNFEVEQMRLARKYGGFATLQPRYNLLKPEAEDDLLPYCAAEGIATLVYSPLYMGLLSGKYKGTETFSDFRADDEDFTGPRFRELAGKVGALKPIADKHGLSITQLVLAATLANPQVNVVIVGIKEPRHIEEAAAVIDKAVSREDYWHIRRTLGTY